METDTEEKVVSVGQVHGEPEGVLHPPEVGYYVHIERGHDKRYSCDHQHETQLGRMKHIPQ